MLIEVGPEIILNKKTARQLFTEAGGFRSESVLKGRAHPFNLQNALKYSFWYTFFDVVSINKGSSVI